MINKVLYFGNFSLTNGFASVNRAIGISRLFSQLSYKTTIYLDNEDNEFVNNLKIFDNEITVKHKSIGNKYLAYYFANEYIKIIKSESPKIVVLFDFPYFVARKIIKLCKKCNIKVLGDFTEWFDSSGYKGISKILKTMDTELRMKHLPKMLDGSIAISEYLFNHLKSISNKPVIKIYPLMDYVKFELNSLNKKKKEGSLSIAYVGNQGGGKDLVKEVIEYFVNHHNSNIKLFLAGNISYPEKISTNIKCFGNVSHRRALEILLSCDYQVIYREPKKSNNAGFPTKFSESIILGLPVISSEFSDIGLILKNEDGYLFTFEEQKISDILDSVVFDYANHKKKHVSPETKKVFLSKTYLKPFKTFLNLV